MPGHQFGQVPKTAGAAPKTELKRKPKPKTETQTEIERYIGGDGDRLCQMKCDELYVIWMGEAFA